MPADELEHVRKHLPQCSKCIGALGAAIQRRTLPGRPAPTAPGPLLGGTDPGHGRWFRSLAVALSLIALGSSATCWYLDTPMPGEGRSPNEAAPSHVTRGALGGVE